jgi:hypothetical protein
VNHKVSKPVVALCAFAAIVVSVLFIIVIPFRRVLETPGHELLAFSIPVVALSIIVSYIYMRMKSRAQTKQG